MSDEIAVKVTNYNPHLPCALQEGHLWQRVAGKNDFEQPVNLEICQNCKKVRSAIEGA